MFKLKEHWQILIALVAAAIVGAIFGAEALKEAPFVKGATAVCQFFGDLFMNALKMVIVPLIVASIISGIAGLGKMEGFGRLGGKTIGYYAGTSLIAILTGLILVNAIKPGYRDGKPDERIKQAFDAQAELIAKDPAQFEKVTSASGRAEKGTKNIADVLKDMVPANPVKAAADGQMLGLIFFSILIGWALTQLTGDGPAAFKNMFDGLNDVMIAITRLIMKFAPIGVFALVVPVIAETGVTGVFQSLAKFAAVVLLALGIHFFVAMPLLLKFVGKVSPIRHYKAMAEALLTAFSTASSSATLPITLRCIRDNAGVSRRVSSFTLPLGATVNMDGTALYECVVVIFAAQVVGVEMTFGEQFVVVFLALITSIGVAGVPSASLVAILIILNSAKIPGLVPEAAMAFILTVDRFLDMCRTAVNVFSDSCGAVIIARTEGEEDVLSGGPGGASAKG
ncbi:MAG: dicarboxylate/amino acid:cation symporter [Verrucomicrobiales bacterium]